MTEELTEEEKAGDARRALFYDEIGRILAEETEQEAASQLRQLQVSDRTIAQLLGSRFHGVRIGDLHDLAIEHSPA